MAPTGPGTRTKSRGGHTVKRPPGEPAVAPGWRVTPGVSGAMAGALSRGHVPLPNAIVRGHGIWWGDSETVRARCSTVPLPPPEPAPGTSVGREWGGCGWGGGAGCPQGVCLSLPGVPHPPFNPPTSHGLSPPSPKFHPPHSPSHHPASPPSSPFPSTGGSGHWVTCVTSHSPSPACLSWASVSLSEQHSP